LKKAILFESCTVAASLFQSVDAAMLKLWNHTQYVFSEHNRGLDDPNETMKQSS